MIQFSEATAIAIHVMIYIANRKNSTISLKEIAGVFSISENHLSKVLQRLVKVGFLTSIKGPKGGFRLVEGKELSTLMQIYESIEGEYTRVRFVFDDNSCLFSSRHFTPCCCIMKPLIQTVNDSFESFMNNHRISDLKL